ncbi:MAG: hypothetical protein FD181_3681 [Prolixibacteraceae bacterium]|nr:MAG: hypothetical protein FD181_3681 [Prolixibacteraceae bacterium]
MKFTHCKKNILTCILIFLGILLSGNISGQINGSLFMLPNNFYAQVYNPAYMRTDKAIEISFAGLSGFSFMNQGSFKISDLITTPYGIPVIDPVHFYENIRKNNHFSQDVSVPMAFFSFPLKKGVFSAYYKENASSALKFKKDVIEFLVNGNTEPKYRNFNTDAVSLITAGYREFAVGYTKKMNKKLDAGAHAKLLFGAAFFNADNWNYKIETSADGSLIKFRAAGKGYLSLPLPVVLRADSTIFSVKTEGAFSKYMKAYQNPGFAVDLGINYRINKKSSFSVSVRDLGIIWYNDNGMTLSENQKYNYIGFDLVHAVRFIEEPGYEHPMHLIDLVKDSIRNVWHPKVVKSGFTSALATKTVLHYQYQSSEKLSFGVTNQSAFQKNNFWNILTFTAMQSWPNFSAFGNLNLHQANNVSVGGGFQYEGDFFQAFLATDNIFAFYHPANNKTFSVTAGVCILLNHKKVRTAENDEKGIKKRKGKISPDLPYYKELRELRR